MPRKRKRNWPQRCYRFAVTSADIPESMWAQAKLMQALWNRLCEMHAEVRASISETTPEEERKAKWAQFELDARASAKAAGLRQECDADVLDRFTKACVAAAREPARGWPKPRGLSVSIRHRYGGGGTPLPTIVSDRAKRVRVNGPVSFSALGRQRNAARKGADSRFRHGVFQLNNGDNIRFTIQQHEPINPGAIVKSVRWVGRRAVAFGWTWWLIVQTEEPPVERVPTGRACGIDVGWRKRGDALRLAFLADDTGTKRELLLPLDFSTKQTRRERIRRPHFEHQPQNHAELRDLARQRDERLEELKADLRALLSPLPAGFDKMRGRGLVRLMHELPDTESIARQRIEQWREWDRPRFRRETRARQRFAQRRVDLYRNLAAEIAKTYDTINVEAVGVKRMIEDDERDPALKAADRYHQIAAPSDFLRCLSNAARKYGSQFVRKDAKKTTTTCSDCGAEMTSGADLMQRCVNGHLLDQDENAARNLLSQTFGVYERSSRLRKQRGVETTQVAEAEEPADQ